MNDYIKRCGLERLLCLELAVLALVTRCYRVVLLVSVAQEVANVNEVLEWQSFLFHLLNNCASVP